MKRSRRTLQYWATGLHDDRWQSLLIRAEKNYADALWSLNFVAMSWSFWQNVKKVWPQFLVVITTENIAELFYICLVWSYLEDSMVFFGLLYLKAQNRGRREQKHCWGWSEIQNSFNSQLLDASLGHCMVVMQVEMSRANIFETELV